MARRQPVPEALRTRPFLLDEALAAGLTAETLQGRRFVRLHRRAYICADVELTREVRLRAALLVLPKDAAAASVTALQHFGVNVGPPMPLHTVTNHPHQVRLNGIICHRHRHRHRPGIAVRRWSGLPTCVPEQAWVQACRELGFLDRVVAGDWLLQLKRTRLATLQAYVGSSREHGVKRARRALAYVRERVESPRETRLRMMLVFGTSGGWVGVGVDCFQQFRPDLGHAVVVPGIHADCGVDLLLGAGEHAGAARHHVTAPKRLHTLPLGISPPRSDGDMTAVRHEAIVPGGPGLGQS